jgi:hypothetical protein
VIGLRSRDQPRLSSGICEHVVEHQNENVIAFVTAVREADNKQALKVCSFARLPVCLSGALSGSSC